MQLWAKEILDGSSACAELLDQAKGGHHYRQAVQQQFAKIDDAELTPSARVLRDMTKAQQSFYAHTLALAEQHRAHFAARPLTDNDQVEFVRMSEQSLSAQTELETRQQLGFDEYLDNYYAQYRGCSCAK